MARCWDALGARTRRGPPTMRASGRRRGFGHSGMAEDLRIALIQLDE